MQHARDRIRELTDRRRLLLPVEWIVQDVNRFLRGWAGYFRYGNSARPLRQDQGLRADAAGAGRSPNVTRAAERSGWSVVAFQSPNQLGLIGLDGIVVAPRPFRAWRGQAECRR